MASASWELQKAIYAALVADATLEALLGGTYIYDDVPRGASFPYVTFAGSTHRDWSTGTETASEHFVTLNAWSKQGGEKQAHLVVEAIRAALHDAALSLDGFRLVNLRHDMSDTGRQAGGETYVGTVRFRAVIEPAS